MIVGRPANSGTEAGSPTNSQRTASLAFGGACDDQSRDYWAEFSQMWRNVTFMQQGTAFNYYGSPDNKKFLPWTKVIPPFQSVKRLSAGNTFVFARETTRINFFARN
jgi:hypothetical protein